MSSISVSGGSTSVPRTNPGFELRLLAIKLINDGGVLKIETRAAGDQSPIYNPGLQLTGQNNVRWTMTTGAQTGTYVAGETITGGISGRTGVVISKTATTITFHTWSGLAWTGGEPITGGTSGATCLFTSMVAAEYNQASYAISTSSDATSNQVWMLNVSADTDVAGFGGVAVVAYNDTDTAVNCSLEGLASVTKLVFTDAATGASFLLNTTNVGAGEIIIVNLMAYTPD